MPTGYTYRIEDEDDYTFEKYVWDCAKAFVGDRDTGAIVRSNLNDSYHEKLARTKQELEKLCNMSAAEVAHAAMKANESALKYWEEAEVKRTREAARYDAMLAKVKAWKPPTPHHINLKKFMRQQIEISCTANDRKPRSKPEPMTADEWSEAHRASLEWDINYYTKCIERKNTGAYNRNDWIDALQKSVPSPEEK